MRILLPVHIVNMSSLIVLMGGDPGPWWDGEDGAFEVTCNSCKRDFALETCWHPRFETYKISGEMSGN